MQKYINETDRDILVNALHNMDKLNLVAQYWRKLDILETLIPTKTDSHKINLFSLKVRSFNLDYTSSICQKITFYFV